MRELRLVGVEDGAVTLEALDGEKLKLPIDEQVRAAVRNAAINATSSLALSPREIQDRIRSGETIADIVTSSGVNEDFVTKFAQPVMDELAHVIASALAIRITIAGDRFNDPTQVEFGDLIQERLSANSAKDITWSSRRIAGGTWQLECNYTIADHRAQSVWLYEPRRFHLAPENEAAIALSNADSIDGPIAKLRSLNTVTVTQSTPSDAPAAFRKDAEVSQPSEPETNAANTGTTTTLLDEIRKRRESQSEASSEIVSEAVAEEIAEVDVDEDVAHEFIDEVIDEPFELEVVEDSADLADEPAQEAQIEEPSQEAQSEEPQPKKSRASMPSWDEIVFGTKTDE